ncbi:MAG: efflux RND transporter periplasmic adaptor subunit [Bryobacteraceae bacterium]|jgi:multidrug efflux pump subunit AcrA (membrane-fusion protein)
MSQRSRRLWLRIGVLLVAVAAAGAGIERLRRSRAEPELPSIAVRKGDFLVLVHTRGELTSRRSAALTAPQRVPDLQIVWLAPAGSTVEAGDVVIRFDASRAQQQLQERAASLKQAQATLDQAVAQARITAEQDKLDLEQAGYAVERAKLEASKQAIVSQIQGDESRIDLGMAEEKLRVEQATIGLHVKSGEAKIASATRLRDQQQREIDLTRDQLAKMEVRSPLKGFVTYGLNSSQGWMNRQPFKVGDHAWPGALIGEVPDPASMEMESRVDEVDRGKIAPGMTVLVHVDAYPEKTFEAHLASVSPLTEQSFGEWPPIRSFKAYATIAPPDARLRPGMNAAADFVITRIPDTLSIPAKALFTRRGKPVVYIRAGSMYAPREVAVLARNPDEVAIGGVPPGTRVALQEPPEQGERQ